MFNNGLKILSLEDFRLENFVSEFDSDNKIIGNKITYPNLHPPKTPYVVYISLNRYFLIHLLKSHLCLKEKN